MQGTVWQVQVSAATNNPADAWCLDLSEKKKNAYGAVLENSENDTS